MTAVEAINEFVETMRTCGDTFRKIGGTDENLANCIESFRTGVSAITSDKSSVKDSDIENIRKGIIRTLEDILGKVGKELQTLRENMKFINGNVDSFNIAVFGKVKAGKSYTGNFIMGNVIRDMKIATAYDSLPRPKVTVIDKGKITSSEKLAEIEGKEGFIVDPNEATSTIQLFELGGMKWIDTPGIGSVTQANELLAQEFIDSADLVVYMSNSDAAGTQQDFTELGKLHEKGKRFLLLLTQSDDVDEDCDDDGNIISTLVPKSEKDRASMEDYICKSLLDNKITELERGREVLTISTKLALEGLKNHDEAMFDASNLKKFLEVLIDITKHESADLKMRTPARTINAAIADIVNMLETAKDTLHNHGRELNSTEERLTEKNAGILETMKQKCEQSIDEIITENAAKVEEGGTAISADELASQLSGVVYGVVIETCAKEFAVSADNLSSYADSLKISGIGSLEMQTIEHSHIMKEVRRVRRDPYGLVEHVKSFFGKEYYGTETRDKEVKSIEKRQRSEVN